MSESSPAEQSTPSQVTGSSVPNVQNPSHPSFRRYAQSIVRSETYRGHITDQHAARRQRASRACGEFPVYGNKPSTEALTATTVLMDLEHLRKALD